MTRFTDVLPEEVDWWWPGRLPLAKLVVLEGDPGLGKSTLAISMGVAISAGRALPGGVPRDPASVIYVGHEDGLADTILPRVRAAGGDESAFYSVSMEYGEDDTLFTIPDHVPKLLDRWKSGEMGSVGLLVIDPLTAALSPSIDAYRDHDVRRALASLSHLADATGATILAIRHLTK